MPILLPLTFFIITFLCFEKSNRAVSLDWRDSFLRTALLWGTCIFLSTEVLSIFQLFNFGYVAGFWTLLSLSAIITFIKLPKNNIQKYLNLPQLKLVDFLLLASIGLIILCVGIIALNAPPNTYDSMTYHMSRVAHWAQNKTVAHYPTHIIRQLNYPPWCEFAITHFQILTQSDRFANIVQFLSMGGSIIGVSLITKLLGGSQRTQIIASVLATCIPMGILQGSSTQNDYTVGFWLICFIYYLLRLHQNFTWKSLITAAIALGLATLTKGTAYLYSIPFLIIFTLAIGKKSPLNVLKLFLVLITSIIIFNSGYFARNYQLTQTLLPPSESSNMVNQKYGVKPFISNMIRNSGLNFGTPFRAANNIVEQIVYNTHSLLNIDITDNDTTFGQAKFVIKNNPFHEDNTGNFLHITLLIICILVFPFLKKTKTTSVLWMYFFATIGTTIIFNLILQWSQFHIRYHLPIFILASPLMAMVLSHKKNQFLPISISGLILLCSLPWVFFSESRPLLGQQSVLTVDRHKQYFNNQHGYIHSYTTAVDAITSLECFEIGLDFGTNTWEYPLWPLFQSKNNQLLRIEHINVENDSSEKTLPYPLGPFDPCTIIEQNTKTGTRIIFNNQDYIKTRRFAFLSVFQKDSSGELTQQSIQYHLRQAFEISRKANNVLNDPQKHIELRQEELKEVQLIDLNSLSNVDDTFKILFYNSWKKGLEQFVEGTKLSNQQLAAEGLKKVIQWNYWIDQNKHLLKRMFNR